MNCEDMGAVERAYAAVKDFDDINDPDPLQRAHWGGGFSFRDPDGNVWDVAWAEGSSIEEAGGIIFP